MKALVIGLGSIGRRHAANLLRLGHEVVGVDALPSQVTGAAEALGIPFFERVKDAYSNASYDLVCVCTPADTHIELAHEALDAGAHVFIEKPLAVTSEGIRTLYLHAIKAKRQVMVACNYRFHPGLMRLEDIVKTGKIGLPLSARAVMGHDVRASRKGVDYRATYAVRPEKGGGVIVDSGSHVVEYLAALFGRPTHVQAQAAQKVLTDPVEDYAVLLLQHSSGVSSLVELDYFSKPKRHLLEVQGSEGWVIWDFPGNKVEWYTPESGKQSVLVYENASEADMRNDSYVREMESCIRSIESGTPPLQSIVQAAHVVRVLEEAKAAALTGNMHTIVYEEFT